jgi:signal peptidase I
MTTAAEGESTPRKEDESSFFDIAKTIIYALALAMAVRFVLVQPFRIPSGSMQPTLYVGDYVVVSKWSYGYSRFAFAPFEKILPAGRLFGAPLERGDIVVFRPPHDVDTDYIKRVIGLPGDRVRIVNGQIFLNGEAARRERLDVRRWMDIDKDNRTRAVEVIAYKELLPGQTNAHLVFERGEVMDGACVSASSLDLTPSGFCAMDNFPREGGEHVVPEGHFFMMGDDRDNSDDSRGSVRDVPADNLVGKAQFVLLSTEPTAKFQEPWTWWHMRGDRFFRGVD